MHLNAFSKKLCTGLPALKKTGRMIKILSFLLLAACLQLAAKTEAQGISLSVNNASLVTVFNEIQQQSNFHFIYTSEELATSSKVSLSVQHASLDKVLEICFKDQPLSYSIEDKFIIVKIKQKKNTREAIVETGIAGKVYNEKDEPIAGVSVRLKNTEKGTATNNKGEFELGDVAAGSIIIFSSIGYEPQAVLIGNNRFLNIHLQTTASALDEMVIKGYYSTSKRLNTGSVSKITAEQIIEQPVSSALASMEGRMSGVFITQNTGTPGSGYSIEIRGQNSLRNSSFDNGNYPLYIVDGVPFTSSGLTSSSTNYVTNGGNPLNFINIADIESIEVLKDADATAIYGSRGANGVVLITTKKGNAGKTKVDINFYSGIGKITRKMDLLNTQQYLQMRHEAFSNDGISVLPSNAYDVNGVWDTTRYTDWQKLLIGNTAHISDGQAAISGGNSNTQFLFGSGYHHETTVFPGDFADNRGSAHFNLNHLSTNQKLKFSLFVNYMSDYNNILATDLTGQSLKLAPDAPPLYTADGKLNWANSTWNNPAALLQRKYKINTNNLVSSMLVSYLLLPGLQIKTNIGYTNLQSNEVSINPISSYKPSLNIKTGSAIFASGSSGTWIAEPQLEYVMSRKSIKWSALIGMTIQENSRTTQSNSASGFTSDALLENIAAASRIVITDNSYTQYRYNALFGRLNAEWYDKYLFNLTARRDGSSRFGPGKQFANFGALGLGWIFSKEALIKKKLPFLSFGKFRGSYGLTGNDQIPDYGYLETYSPTPYPYQNTPGLYPTGLSNSDYSWETNRKIETALELGFIKNRILISTGYYINRSSNQLVGYSLPATTGFSSVQKNLPAVVQNTGLELELNTVNIKSSFFNWRTSLNLSIPRNKLVSYPGIAGSSYNTTYAIGKPLSIMYALHSTGVDPATGVYTFQDYNHDGSISYPEDLQPLKSVSKNYFGGVQNSFSAGAFALDVFFQFVKQTGLGYQYGGIFVAPGMLSNQPTIVLKRWQKPGDATVIQKYTQNFGSDAYAGYDHIVSDGADNVIEDASYIRLKNLSVSYTVSRRLIKKLRIENARCYIQGQNLLTITKFSGSDPENYGTGRIPPLKVISAGIQVTL